jgi:hypothetical protein
MIMDHSQLNDQISMTLISISITMMSFDLINYQMASLVTPLAASITASLEAPLTDVDQDDNEKLEDLEEEKYHINEHPIFSRIESNTEITCNFCKKTASYNDMDNKNYCWFHRSQYE